MSCPVVLVLLIHVKDERFGVVPSGSKGEISRPVRKGISLHPSRVRKLDVGTTRCRVRWYPDLVTKE